MADPVELVLGLINSNDTRKAESFSAALGSVMNRRNSNIFWRALIGKAALLVEQRGGAGAGALDMAKIFARSRLDPNMSLDNGDFPINVMVGRSPKLGALALESFDFDLNVLDKSGRTPGMLALEAARALSAPSFDVVSKMVGAKGFRPEVGDQGARICFRGLVWIQVAAGLGADVQEGAACTELLLDKLAEKGYDFNAARETPDSKYGSTINTPLAYCIKKAVQWLESSRAPRSGAKMGEAVWFTAQELMRRGADPCLQMEATDRVLLLDLCRGAGLPSGMTQSLEAGLLSRAIDGPPPSGARSPRRI